MKIIDPGHMYHLDMLDCEEGAIQLTFVKREGDKFPGNKGSYPGTILQECWRAEIDRLKYVMNQVPCAESQACIDLLRTCIFLLESRAARRHNRVLDMSSLYDIENEPTCSKCGHIRCKEHI